MGYSPLAVGETGVTYVCVSLPLVVSDSSELSLSNCHRDGNYGVCSVQWRLGRKSCHRIYICVDSHLSRAFSLPKLAVFVELATAP
jgi:hypothetical protein